MRARLTVCSIILLTLLGSQRLRAQSAAPASANTQSNSPASAQPPALFKSCEEVATSIADALSQVRNGTLRITDNGQTPEEYFFQQYVATLVNTAPCFFQANQSNPEAVKRLTPARVSLWNALQNLSGSQQVGSSLSSSGSTNPVSKPAGPTALAEEFGGANVTTGTSSLTAQWSPGTMLANMVLGNATDLCPTGQTSHCVRPGFLAGLMPLTVKITSNTSSASPSVTGTSTTPSSTSSSQQVTVAAKGTQGPSFSGLTVSYSFGAKSKKALQSIAESEADAKANREPSSQAPAAGQNGSQIQPASSQQTSGATQNSAQKKTQTSSSPNPAAQLYVENLGKEFQTAFTSTQSATNCSAFNLWLSKEQGDFTKAVANIDVPSLTAQIETWYQELFNAMLNAPDCQRAIQNFSNFYAAVLATRAAEEVLSVQASAVPQLGVEYDLNTPQDKPAYSTFKLSGNWQWRFAKTAALLEPTSPAITAIQKFVDQAQPIGAATNPANASSAAKQMADAAKPPAQAATPPWSFSFNGAVDVYNAEPASTIPSASHLRDIQAGGELAYLFSPSTNSGPLREFIGSVRLSGAYSYQDQTSPAILTGPALTDFSGLPSSTTSAYAKRGVIHLGQIKLALGTGSSFSYPLALTYSNRTELVTHPTWGVQFGVSYNLSSLFTSSTPSPQ